jgi:autotransporter translocation and assembly factor TamB
VNLALEQGIAGQKPPTLEGLDIDARYAAGRVDVRIAGREEASRVLEVAASANIGDPSSLTASVQAANFDIAPLVAFGAGRVRAARGTLNAALAIHGIDPQTGTIRGKLSIKDGRIPLSPELGNLRRASIDVEIVKQRLAATFEGKLGTGGGSVKGKLTATIAGGLPAAAQLDMKVTKVSPIGALQPVVDADITGTWKRAPGDQLLWTGELAIKNAKIVVPPDTGNELLLIGAPPDMIFVDKQKAVKWTRHPPTKPWLETKVTIGNTDVDVQDDDFRVRVTARGKLDVAVGDGLGVSGTISTTKGEVTALTRRYRVESGVIDFDDGTTDPRLDLRIAHDFKTLTLTLDVRGRASAPVPVLTSDPGGYTQGQLMSFLLGADPDTESTSTATQNQALVSSGLAMLSGRIGRRVTKYLPMRLDQLAYEPPTSSSSQALTLPLWRGARSNLVWRQHLGARPDENPGEAVFDYDLKPNVTFEATVGERSKGGDFLWRTRW